MLTIDLIVHRYTTTLVAVAPELLLTRLIKLLVLAYDVLTIDPSHPLHQQTAVGTETVELAAAGTAQAQTRRVLSSQDWIQRCGAER